MAPMMIDVATAIPIQNNALTVKVTRQTVTGDEWTLLLALLLAQRHHHKQHFSQFLFIVHDIVTASPAIPSAVIVIVAIVIAIDIGSSEKWKQEANYH